MSKYLLPVLLFLFSCNYLPTPKESVEVTIAVQPTDKEKLKSILVSRIESAGMSVKNVIESPSGFTYTLNVPKGYSSNDLKDLFQSNGLMSMCIAPDALTIFKGIEFFKRDHPELYVENGDTSIVIYANRPMDGLQVLDTARASRIIQNCMRLEYIAKYYQYSFRPFDDEFSNQLAFSLDFINTNKVYNFYPDKIESMDMKTDPDGFRNWSITLKPAYHTELENFTAQNLNRKCVTTLGGKSIMSPIIRSAIPGGAISVSGGPDEDYTIFKAIAEFPYPTGVYAVSIRNLDHFYPGNEYVQRYEKVQAALVLLNKKEGLQYMTNKKEPIGGKEIKDLLKDAARLDLPDFIRLSEFDSVQTEQFLTTMETLIEQANKPEAPVEDLLIK